MIDLARYKTIPLGGGRFAGRSTMAPLQMRETGGQWQEIKPVLVQDGSGYHVEGTPYLCQIGSDGSRVITPDRTEPSKYVRLPSNPLFSALPKTVVSGFNISNKGTALNTLSMPTSWGGFKFGMETGKVKFEVVMTKAPSNAVFGASPRIQLDVDSNLDITSLLSAKEGLAIPKPHLFDAVGNVRDLTWNYKAGQLELPFDLTGLKFPVTLRNTTIDVAASADDAYMTADETTTVSITGVTAYVIRNNGANYRASAGFRFQMPGSGTADTCTFTSYATYADYNLRCVIYFNDVDTAVNFTTSATLDSRVKTTANVPQTKLSFGGSNGTAMTTDSLQACLAEIFGRAGWVADNYIMVMLIGVTGDYDSWKCYTRDNAAAPYYPELNYTYTPPVTGGFVPRVIII